MGTGRRFSEAFGKASLAAGVEFPTGGRAFLSVRDADKSKVVEIARGLLQLGFELLATRGTQATLVAAGLPCVVVNKVAEGRPHVVDMMKNGEISFIVNTTDGKQTIADSGEIRRTALHQRIAYVTTAAGARATVQSMNERVLATVYRLQSLHKELAV
jgi:carbamoyl-phosphate synthase large subunit